jgi:ankyrin repeat protein
VHAANNSRFQWAYLQIKQLLELNQEITIRDQLGKLPKDLKAAYDEIYSLMSQSEKKIADRAFQWVMCSNIPLTSAILLPAVCQDPENDAVNSLDDLDEELLLEYCRNMLVIDPYRRVWVPSHLSVIEYLESHVWKQHEANRLVASVCLSLLNDTTWYDREDESEEGSVESNLVGRDGSRDGSLDRLRLYARHNWISHVRNCEYQGSNDRVSNLLKRFFGSPMESSIAYQEWYKMLEYDEDLVSPFYYPLFTPPERYLPRDIEPISSASYGICALGLYDLLSDWFTIPWVEYRSKNIRGRSLLQLAAIAGSHPICECLIQWGADVKELLEDEDYGNALIAAAAQGRKQVVKLLVESGADVNAEVNATSGSALLAAVSHGNPEVLELLLDAKADPNSQVTTWTNGIYKNQGNALITAINLRHKESMKLLVKYGADINAQGQFGQFGSALIAAILNFPEIVSLLIELGADVNMRVAFGVYGSALNAAIYQDLGQTRCEVVQVMLDNGADFDSEFRVGEGNALHFAKRLWGSSGVVELLEGFGAKWEPEDETKEKLKSTREVEFERHGRPLDLFQERLAFNQLQYQDLRSFGNPFAPNPSGFQGQIPIQNVWRRTERRASL